jgi:hypothetical protein
MWEAVADVVKSAMTNGAPGVIVIIIIAWFFDRWRLVKDLRDLNDKMIEAFQENTKAITELSTLISQLCNRI